MKSKVVITEKRGGGFLIKVDYLGQYFDGERASLDEVYRAITATRRKAEQIHDAEMLQRKLAARAQTAASEKKS
jgi:hypothetical protein